MQNQGLKNVFQPIPTLFFKDMKLELQVIYLFIWPNMKLMALLVSIIYKKQNAVCLQWIPSPGVQMLFILQIFLSNNT